MNESEKMEEAPGWVSGDSGAADLITLQGRPAGTHRRQAHENRHGLSPPSSHVMSRVESVPGLAQVKVSTVPTPLHIRIRRCREGEQEVSKHLLGAEGSQRDRLAWPGSHRPLSNPYPAEHPGVKQGERGRIEESQALNSASQVWLALGSKVGIAKRQQSGLGQRCGPASTYTTPAGRMEWDSWESTDTRFPKVLVPKE